MQRLGGALNGGLEGGGVAVRDVAVEQKMAKWTVDGRELGCTGAA